MLRSVANNVNTAHAARQGLKLDVNVPQSHFSEIFGNDYEIIDELGRGGMGIVFRARQRKLDRIVALKVLPAILSVVRPGAKARFRREAELVSQLQHTNIIPVFDFGETGETLYFSMALVEGPSLRTVINDAKKTGVLDHQLRNAKSENSQDPNRSKNLKNERSQTTTSNSLHHTCGSTSKLRRALCRRAAEWIADVAEALSYAHQQGVIHRDIKPSNLLLSSDGRIMISDFGLARSKTCTSITKSHSPVGTARYMSPERIEKTVGPVDHRADIYSLGATLYELLTLHPPFADVIDRDLQNEILSREPLSPRKFSRDIPRELELITLKALEANPSNRYSSAQAMAMDLRRWQLGLPIEARRRSLPIRLLRHARRRKLLTSSIVAVLALTIASAYFYRGYMELQNVAQRTSVDAEEKGVRLLYQDALQDFRAHRLESGLVAIAKVLENQPNHLEGQLLRARLLYRTGRKTDAIGQLQTIIDQDVNVPDAHFQLAVAFDRIGDMRSAEHREQLERLSPKSAGGMYLLARVEEDPWKAIDLFSRGLELEPWRVELVMGRSIQLLRLKKYEEALVDAERATSLFGSWPKTYIQKGLALTRLGRTNEAIRAFDRAIEMEPDSDKWFNFRAKAHFKNGDYDSAISDFSSAIELQDVPAQTSLIHLGMAYELSGDCLSAQANYNRVADSDGPFKNYALLWSYLLMKQETLDEQAQVLMDMVIQESDGNRWFESLCEFFNQDLDSNELIRKAGTEDEQCEAHYYIGRRLLIGHRFDEAIDAFSRCIILDRPNLLETELSYALYKELSRVARVELEPAPN